MKCVQQVKGRRRVRRVDRQDVHPREHLVEAFPPGRLQILLDLGAQPAAVVIMDLHPEDICPPRDRLPDPAHPQDAQPAPADPAANGDDYILPGFIDLHVHGGDGADFMDLTADAFRGHIERTRIVTPAVFCVEVL